MGGSGVVVAGRHHNRSVDTTWRGELAISAFFRGPKITPATVTEWELIGSEWVSTARAVARYARAITWGSYVDQSSLRGQLYTVRLTWADGAHSMLKLEEQLFQHLATLLADRKAPPPDAPSAAPAFPPPEIDIVARLERLEQLRSRGSLSDDEFVAAKAELLRGR